jgi:DNA-binding SARP family transcriptional activator
LADPRVRVQLCGRVCVEIGGERRESLLPGPQGRRLFAYLTLHRLGALSRSDLVNAIWGDDPPAAPETALGALLSRLRRALAPIPVGAARLSLPDDAWVDLEAAREAAHRAESAMVRGDPGRAWGAAQITLFTARRGFLPGDDLPWIADVRRELDALYVRALEAYAGASLRVGGTELATAERSARELVARAPFSESGYRVLMEGLAQRGNVALATGSASRPARLPVTCTPASCGRGPADLRRAWRAPAPIPCNTGMAAVPWLPWVPANHTYQAPGGRI